MHSLDDGLRLKPSLDASRTFPSKEDSNLELSIVMPCLNESETLATCIRKAQRFLAQEGVVGEIIVTDNGSPDGSRQIAEQMSARVIMLERRGYGAAIMGGVSIARGKYVIMGDSDDSYDFSALMPLLKKLREGYELVMGNRFKGEIKSGAMPPLHYRIVTLEVGLLAGALMILGGMGGTVYGFISWSSSLFGPQDPSRLMRVVIPSVLLLVLGLQTVLTSFFLSILGLKRQHRVRTRPDAL